MTPIIYEITRQDDIMNVRRALQRKCRRRRLSYLVFRYATAGLGCALVGVFLALLFMGAI